MYARIVECPAAVAYRSAFQICCPTLAAGYCLGYRGVPSQWMACLGGDGVGREIAMGFVVAAALGAIRQRTRPWR